MIFKAYTSEWVSSYTPQHMSFGFSSHVGLFLDRTTKNMNIIRSIKGGSDRSHSWNNCEFSTFSESNMIWSELGHRGGYWFISVYNNKAWSIMVEERTQ